jgi:hypothetical protein
MGTQPNKKIPEFCAVKRLSRSKYFEMRKRGRGPRESRDGRWVTITPEAERDWDREREQEQVHDDPDG